jgi:hypothetical protein
MEPPITQDTEMPPVDMNEPPMGPEPNEEEGEPIPSPEETPSNDSQSEIDDIFNALDTEKQAAVIKYAKSMVNSKDDGDDTPKSNMEESKQRISEIINDVIDDEMKNREDKKIRNKNITCDNPFKSNR